MNDIDADRYYREIGAHVTGTPMAADSPLRRYEGKSIEPVSDCPQGHILFTPLQNLGFGLHDKIQRDKSWHSRKRVLEYTFDLAFDYELENHRACAIATPVGQ